MLVLLFYCPSYIQHSRQLVLTGYYGHVMSIAWPRALSTGRFLDRCSDSARALRYNRSTGA